MNAIRFAFYTGLLWAGASLLLIELSILSGSGTAWVELDFRFISGTVLIILHSLDYQQQLIGTYAIYSVRNANKC